MRLFRHPWWQHLDYRVKVATTQENKPPTQGTRQWTFTTPRWRCGSILLPSYTESDKSKIFQCADKNHVGPTFNYAAKFRTSCSPGDKCLNFGNPPQLPPRAATKIAPGPIAQNRHSCCNSKSLAIRRCGRTMVEIRWKSSGLYLQVGFRF